MRVLDRTKKVLDMIYLARSNPIPGEQASAQRGHPPDVPILTGGMIP